MNWLDKLERKFGRYAIPNLMFYIIVLYGVGYVLDLVSPGFYSMYLSLDVSAILHGQIWRVITFIIEPPTSGLFFVLIMMYLYYMIGKQLESAWGAFRFNLYFFAGVFFHVLAAVLIYLFLGVSMPLTAAYLNLSLFFAFAASYPDLQFLLFFVIPVKAKWLAWIDGAFFLYTILQAFLPAYGGSMYGIVYQARAIAAAVSILNFVIFFMSSRNMQPYTPRQMKRKKEFHRKVKQAQRPVNHYDNGAMHRCAVCGRTELDDPELEFRYCSKCHGNYEYCQDHLFTHKHIE